MLRLLAVLVTLLAIAASTECHSSGRIIEGEVTDITKHPYQVSIRYKPCPKCAYKHNCGGSIINEKIILTAAHCVAGNNPIKLQIVVGTNHRAGYGIFVPIKKIVPHEDYDKNVPFDNDIAIVVLDVELPLNDVDINPIKMTYTRPPTNSIAKVSGWGPTSENGHGSDRLREGDVVIFSNEYCEYQYGPSIITKSMLCAGTATGGKGPCRDDSGGPLVVDGVLVGVVLGGIGCAQREFPTVYASVADLRPWIDAAVNANL